MKRSSKPIDRFDWTLCLLLLLFFIVSCVAIYSAQQTAIPKDNYLFKQIRWYVIGVIIIAGFMYFDSEQIRKITWGLYGFGIILLFILAVSPITKFTPSINNAQSWFKLPFIGTIQPSEFMKVFLILALANIVFQHNEKTIIKTLKTDFYLLIKIGFITFLPIVLVMCQPDLGTSLVILAIMTGMIFASGISWRIILPIYGMGATIAGTILYFVIWAPSILEKYLHVMPYQFDRIYSWLDPASNPTTGYQLLNSLKGIGSGLLTGNGLGDSKVHIPENHTDFIFSVIGEEYGFIGSSIVVSLFFLLIYHLIKTALDTTDSFNTYLCVGIICMITFHVFQNIGMTIQVLPITGIPLPFISYGGSSLMGNMMAMGLIFSIRFHHKSYMFSSE
ncbi:FtsW/RodA/SpoVE family cell cycle protein [Bacillus sp. 03113]|uniref:FtsW/RodA/SpoVE family cell cycle protein n=1 Tax=Bacillus sp. 03113 TaxID=2578211 RepID=UPI001142A619|nr:FtsW/RodA/SpoVE family cell cycle protein [Bacillus sp. 03113]